MNVPDYAKEIRRYFPGPHNKSLRQRLRTIVELEDSWESAGRAVWNVRHRVAFTPGGLASLKLLSEWIRALDPPSPFKPTTDVP